MNPEPITREQVNAFEKYYHMPGIMELAIEKGLFVLVDGEIPEAIK